MKSYQIAIIAGDGIGKEVIPESIKVLEAIAAQCGFFFKFENYDYGCEYYIKHGKMMPDDGLDRLRDSDSTPKLHYAFQPNFSTSNRK